MKVSRSFVLQNVINSDVFTAIFEKRPRKYMFGANNYGDIPTLVNPADNAGWDVFAVGYDWRELKIGKPYKIKEILGYYRLENGNDKIAIRVHVPNYDDKRAKEEIKKYCKKYEKYTRVKGEWVSLKEGY